LVPRQTDDSPLPILPDVLVAAIVLTAAAGGLQQGLGLPAGVLPLALAAYAALALWVWRLIGNRALTPADRVTMGRGLLVMLLIGLLPAAGTGPRVAMLPFALALAAFLLDGVDGWVARRLDCQTAAGARFDMELDAVLLLVLTVWLLRLDLAGAWVLAIGAWRYVFILAGYWRPALRRPLPPSQRRRVICGVQTGALVVLLAPDFPAGWVTPLAAVLLILLSYSFIVDLVAQWRPADP
jgi:phosphatidylglycerophosphate synthase